MTAVTAPQEHLTDGPEADMTEPPQGEPMYPHDPAGAVPPGPPGPLPGSQWPQQPPPGYGYDSGYYNQAPPYGYPGQYGGYGPPGTPPPGHVGWAITALIFFWPLAIPAFINYSRVEGSFYRGDIAGAIRASESVKRYGVIALVIGLVFVALWIFFVATVFTTVDSCFGSGC